MMSSLSFIKCKSYFLQGGWGECILAGVLRFCQAIDKDMGTDGHDIYTG